MADEKRKRATENFYSGIRPVQRKRIAIVSVVAVALFKNRMASDCQGGLSLTGGSGAADQ